MILSSSLKQHNVEWTDGQYVICTFIWEALSNDNVLYKAFYNGLVNDGLLLFDDNFYL